VEREFQQIVQDGTHWRWIGCVDDRSRPYWHTPISGHRVFPVRTVWADYWDLEPEQMQGIRLLRLCSMPICVCPAHRYISQPMKIRKRLGLTLNDWRATRRLMTHMGTAGSLGGAWWDLSLVEAPRADGARFGLPRDVAKALATKLVLPPLAVLAVYGKIISEQVRKAWEKAHGHDEGTVSDEEAEEPDAGQDE
jgi:hypothetical protein